MDKINKHSTLTISTQGRFLKQDTELIMEFLIKIRDFLLKENFKPSEIFPTMNYVCIQMFLDGFEDLELGKETLQDLVSQSVKSQVNLREDLDSKTTLFDGDSYKIFIDNETELIH